nr:MAG TPA: Small Terminase [Caudoviricetes sp.]
MSGKTYKQIAQKHNVTYNEVIYLVKKNKWKRKSNLSKVKKGNQNAKGNRGGPGAEKGNTRALKTGEYETIYDDLLTDEEKAIMKQQEIYDKKYQIISEIKILSIRERRIMQKIKIINDGKDLTIIRMSKSASSYKGSGSTTTTEAESTINIVQRLEEALTRVQEAKRRYIDSYHKIETDDRKLELDLIRLEMEAAKDDSSNTEDMKDDSFIQALNNSTEGAWNDYTEEE